MLQKFFAGDANSPEAVQLALSAIRKHLNMEVAYISEFVGDHSVYQVVDAPGLEALIKVGDSRSLDEVYCRHILAGRLPELMPDTAEFDLAASMPITQAVPIGAHMSVPIRSAAGDPLGMFCCLSPTPNPSLNARDLQVMRVFADMAAHHIVSQKTRETEAAAARHRMSQILETRAFRCVYQPIRNLLTNQVQGFEALCRFTTAPGGPDKTFAEAVAVGLGVELEMAVLEDALAVLAHLPDHIYLSVNASPAVVMSDALPEMFSRFPAGRIVLEITEHASVACYEELKSALAPIRRAGVRLAIDDAGAGYASLQHIITLAPDVIKLDMSLTRAVNMDGARRALTAALVFFSQETNSLIIAEGIETEDELHTLRTLGVPLGQGYLLGRPSPFPDTFHLAEAAG
ncbi:MAG: hypothetical protein B7Z15_05030 [Rhizobiales bacterium 32-66-8]|nr:MAG: hypothetical protein B7Z15_05030 [Rhizobiales bacterium 32-66-8]